MGILPSREEVLDIRDVWDRSLGHLDAGLFESMGRVGLARCDC